MVCDLVVKVHLREKTALTSHTVMQMRHRICITGLVSGFGCLAGIWFLGTLGGDAQI